MKLGVVGLGLIGGSAAMAARVRRVADRIVGIGRTAREVADARATGVINEGDIDVAALKGCDLVLVATPIFAVADVLRSIVGVPLAPGAVVTDCASVKADVVAAGRAALGDRFVGSHPMAGSEKTGLLGASEILFESAVVAVVPEGATEENVRKVEMFWRRLGAVPIRLAAATHDRMVASVSHLPHVVAALLVRHVAAVAERDEAVWGLCAGGFRDTTRIAGSSSGLWREILAANRDEVGKALQGIENEARAFREALAADRMDEVVAALDGAAAARRRIPEKGRGLLPGLAILHCFLPDKPGALADVTGALGRRGINIVDFSLEHVREGAPLRLAFADSTACESARETLAGMGYEVFS